MSRCGLVHRRPPSEIIRRLHLGAGDEILESDIIWTCASCETCFCPLPHGDRRGRGDGRLAVMAEAKGAAKPAGNVAPVEQAPLGTVKIFGRTYDLGAMAAYKAGTSSYGKDTEKFPRCCKKGRLPSCPPVAPIGKR